MKIIKVNANTIDVFMDFDTHPTGFEPSCWLRLHRPKGGAYKQIAGVRLPSHRFQLILKQL